MSKQDSTCRISVFAVAKAGPTVMAEITADDVLEARPDWTAEDAQRFLNTHAEAIGEAMVLAGALAVLGLVGGNDHAQ